MEGTGLLTMVPRPRFRPLGPGQTFLPSCSPFIRISGTRFHSFRKQERDGRPYSFTRIHSVFVFVLFFIRTSNFGAEAERSYIFLRFEAENVLKMFLNYMVADATRKPIKVHCLLRYAGIKLLAHTCATCLLMPSSRCLANQH